MNKKDLTPLFARLSRLIIIVPVVIVIVGLMIKSQHQQIRSNLTTPIKQPLALPQPTSGTIVDDKETATEAAAMIDLVGPWYCQADGFTLWIKNHQIYSVRRNEHYLLQGDCLYIWQNQVSGEKTCGLSIYISLFADLLQTGLFNQGLLETVLSDWSAEENTSSESAMLKKVISSCQKTAVNDGWFIIPKTVIFKESQIE